MVCEYSYYEEDDLPEEPDSRYRVRMKIYDCNPCRSKPNHRYYCKEHRPADLAAVPVLPGTPGLSALPVPSGSPVLPVPGLSGLSATPAAPVVINDYWADDYYRRIRIR